MSKRRTETPEEEGQGRPAAKPSTAPLGPLGQATTSPAVRKFYRYAWQVITGTTSATPGTETSHAHNLGRVPSALVILPTANGVVYRSTVADASNIYVKGSAASLTFEALVIG